MDGTKRINIKPGLRVKIIQKQDQLTGKLKGDNVKVRLVSGLVGRVKQILADA